MKLRSPKKYFTSVIIIILIVLIFIAVKPKQIQPLYHVNSSPLQACYWLYDNKITYSDDDAARFTVIDIVDGEKGFIKLPKNNNEKIYDIDLIQLKKMLSKDQHDANSNGEWFLLKYNSELPRKLNFSFEKEESIIGYAGDAKLGKAIWVTKKDSYFPLSFDFGKRHFTKWKRLTLIVSSFKGEKVNRYDLNSILHQPLTKKIDFPVRVSISPNGNHFLVEKGNGCDIFNMRDF